MQSTNHDLPNREPPPFAEQPAASRPSVGRAADPSPSGSSVASAGSVGPPPSPPESALGPSDSIAGPPPPPPRSPASRSGQLAKGCLFVLLPGGLLLLGGGVYAFYRVVHSFNSLAFESGTASTLPLTEELVTGSPASPRKIVMIDVKGIIVSQRYPRGTAAAPIICRQIKAARRDPTVAAVILDMDTPGGEVTASDEIHHSLQQLRAAGKPVVTCMHTLGASGGYYIAAGTDYIMANRLTLTGSIGVIINAFNYADLFSKIGLRSDVYKSGAMKDMLNGAREPTPEEKRYVQQLVSQTFDEFVRIVAGGRDLGSPEGLRKAPFLDGRVLTGRQALAYHLIDGLGYVDDAIAKARALAGTPKARIIRYRRPGALLEMLFSDIDRNWNPGFASLFPVPWRVLKPGCPYYIMREALP